MVRPPTARVVVPALNGRRQTKAIPIFSNTTATCTMVVPARANFQHHSHLYDGGGLCGGRKQNSNTTSACTMAAGAYQHHAPARSSSLGCSLARSLSHSLANPTFPLPTPGVQVHVSDAQVRNRSAQPRGGPLAKFFLAQSGGHARTGRCCVCEHNHTPKGQTQVLVFNGGFLV